MYNRSKNRRAGSWFRIILLLCVAGSFLLFMAGQAAAENAGGLTIVTIDTGKILEAHPAFAKARKDFETELQGMQKQLKDMPENEQMAFQQKMQQQIQDRGEQLQTDALKAMKEDLRKIADEKGYDLIFDANSLIVGGKDVTEEVMKAMNIESE